MYNLKKLMMTNDFAIRRVSDKNKNASSKIIIIIKMIICVENTTPTNTT